MTPHVLLSSAVLRGCALLEPHPQVVCALTPGDGPHLNPKQSPNEDSVAVVQTHNGWLACVADAHHGHGAGERLVNEVMALAPDAPLETPEHLRQLILNADRRACARTRDRSESTLLVAHLQGNTLTWASLADSMLYVLQGAVLRRLNTPHHVFGGGTLALVTLLQHPSYQTQPVVTQGQEHLVPGAVVVLATDGLETPTSGLTEPDVAMLLGGPGSLKERVRALMDRARSAPKGGKDNVGLVALLAP